MKEIASAFTKAGSHATAADFYETDYQKAPGGILRVARARNVAAIVPSRWTTARVGLSPRHPSCTRISPAGVA